MLSVGLRDLSSRSRGAILELALLLLSSGTRPNALSHIIPYSIRCGHIRGAINGAKIVVVSFTCRESSGILVKEDTFVSKLIVIAVMYLQSKSRVQEVCKSLWIGVWKRSQGFVLFRLKCFFEFRDIAANKITLLV